MSWEDFFHVVFTLARWVGQIIGLYLLLNMLA